MKHLLSCSLLLACCSLAAAQEPTHSKTDLRRDSIPSLTHGTVTATPEMWFYQQERERYEDPKAAVRRNAEHRATQRQRRLETMKWFGFSNIRPSASPTPIMGTYSPMWTSNTADPSQWSGARQPTIVLRSGSPLY